MKTSRVPSTRVRKCRSLRSRLPAKVALVCDIISWRSSTTRIVTPLVALTTASAGPALVSSTMTVTACEHGREVDRTCAADNCQIRCTPLGIRQPATSRIARGAPPRSSRRRSDIRSERIPASPRVATTSARPARRIATARRAAARATRRRRAMSPITSSTTPARRPCPGTLRLRRYRRDRLDLQRPDEDEGATEHDQDVDRQLDQPARPARHHESEQADDGAHRGGGERSTVVSQPGWSNHASESAAIAMFPSALRSWPDTDAATSRAGRRLGAAAPYVQADAGRQRGDDEQHPDGRRTHQPADDHEHGREAGDGQQTALGARPRGLRWILVKGRP